jgi:hypothetical protein
MIRLTSRADPSAARTLSTDSCGCANGRALSGRDARRIHRVVRLALAPNYARSRWSPNPGLRVRRSDSGQTRGDRALSASRTHVARRGECNRAYFFAGRTLIWKPSGKPLTRRSMQAEKRSGAVGCTPTTRTTQCAGRARMSLEKSSSGQHADLYRPGGSVGRLAAGDPVDFAGYKARLVRGEKDEDRRNLDRLRWPLERSVLAELLHVFLRHG